MHFPSVYLTLAMAAVSLSGVVAQSSRCWASASSVTANYGPLSDLRLDANQFCNTFVAPAGVISSAGRLVFGFQSAGFFGNFQSNASCVSTFNSLVTDCYGTANPNRPVTLGGVRTDPGGAELVIAFGDGTKL